jgi:hypothetical protein
MLNNGLEDFVKKAKELYKEIGYIRCPAFNNEKIYFNQKGFKHLIMKNGSYRTRSQQIRRLTLIPYLILIISSVKEIHSYRNSFGIEFWSISKIIDESLIIVVIRQNNKTKPKLFLSVMDKKLSKTQKPREGL